MSVQRLYYEVIENNDWEGEVWHFFVPLTEQEAKTLRTYVAAAGPAYSMSNNSIPEAEVDALMDVEGNTTYQWTYNKCGPLTKDVPEHYDPDNDVLYKGGLFDVVDHCDLPE